MSAPALAGSTRSVVHGGHIQPQGPLRLTRRGRIALIGFPVMLLTALMVLVAAFFTSTAQAAGTAGEPLRTVVVNVAAGETLWSLAGELAPERDPRDVVAEIVEVNGLESSVLQAGQKLEVPVLR
jgi:hypothetical protein